MFKNSDIYKFAIYINKSIFMTSEFIKIKLIKHS